MKLNWFGRLQMNNPARAAAQRRYTARHMLRLGGPVDGGSALEIGCGRGVGIEIILDLFRASRVVAFDLDPKMVRLAKSQTTRLDSEVKISEGTATQIEEPDSAFDAVFDFGVIHQIAGWPKAVTECARVLKPGGRFYFEAVSSRFFRLPMNWAMDRRSPNVRKTGFTRDAYLSVLYDNGIEVGDRYIEPRNPFTGGLVGDLIGVGTKSI